MKTQLIAMAICLLIGGFIGWSFKPDKEYPEVKPNTLIEFRYIDKTDTLIVPKFKTVIKKDTVKFSDTVFVHQETQYIASIDTTYSDSSLTANVEFVSPIPLSNKSYFNMKFSIREKAVTNTIIEKEEWGFFHKRFITYFGIGISYGIDSKTVEPAIQLGLGVRLN